jgi:hypothetical protein
VPSRRESSRHTRRRQIWRFTEGSVRALHEENCKHLRAILCVEATVSLISRRLQLGVLLHLREYAADNKQRLGFGGPTSRNDGRSVPVSARSGLRSSIIGAESCIQAFSDLRVTLYGRGSPPEPANVRMLGMATCLDWGGASVSERAITGTKLEAPLIRQLLNR